MRYRQRSKVLWFHEINLNCIDLPPFPDPPKDLPSNNFHNNFHGGNAPGNGGGVPQDKPSNDLNFDELSRRFDQLKKKL